MTHPFARSSFPQIYEQALVGPLFRPFAELMLADLAPATGESLLDVACGTGIVARLARARLGSTDRVVGVDLSPAMIDLARQVDSEIDWRVGDATALPLQDKEQFDIVTCQQGLQFVRDSEAAVRQMRRALAGGGRLAVSTWVSDDDLPMLRALRRVAERHVGAIVDVRHGFCEAGPIESLLRDAGFSGVRSRIVSRTIRFADGLLLVRLNAFALVSMSAGATEMDDEKREHIRAAIERDSTDAVRPYADGAGLAFELKANLATARG